MASLSVLVLTHQDTPYWDLAAFVACCGLGTSALCLLLLRNLQHGSMSAAATWRPTVFYLNHYTICIK